MQLPAIAPGMTGTASRVVAEPDLATTLGSGTVDVFGTPAMIALMEEAAVAALADILPPELTSVGIYLDVTHLAATPPGMRVEATATVTELNDRAITFEVAAADTVEPIGRGIHRRMIVDSARFQQRAAAKSNQG